MTEKKIYPDTSANTVNHIQHHQDHPQENAVNVASPQEIKSHQIGSDGYPKAQIPNHPVGSPPQILWQIIPDHDTKPRFHRPMFISLRYSHIFYRLGNWPYRHSVPARLLVHVTQAMSTLHSWVECKNTGITIYRKCKSCHIRNIHQYHGGGYQPIDRQWLDTGKFFEPYYGSHTDLNDALTNLQKARDEAICKEYAIPSIVGDPQIIKLGDIPIPGDKTIPHHTANPPVNP